jgi:hypothetical protein
MQMIKRSEAGMAALEAALVLPLLLLVVFAIVELGLGFARLQIVQNAAREGARAAVLFRPTCSESIVKGAATTAVQRFSNTLGMGTLPAPTVTPSGTVPAGQDPFCAAPFIRVEVIFRHEIPLTGGFMSFFTGGPLFLPLPGRSTAATQPTRTP